MPKALSLPPNPFSMLNSMRAIGYSFPTAVADIVDNSIAAGATRIDIRTSVSKHEEIYFAVLDNGCGMCEDELILAMQIGSRSPECSRSRKDLGRFGLGLKTASLSQCRTLTVISFKESSVSAASWNLNLIENTSDWSLEIFDEKEIKHQTLLEELKKNGSGTAVIWEDFDRLGAVEKDKLFDVLKEKLQDTREHLSLVFHRFLSQEDKFSPITISINGNPLIPKDPFLKSDDIGSVFTGTILFPIKGIKECVRVTSYTLPPQDKMTAQHQKKLGVAGRGLQEDQGFYIYRERRLIFWGGWFGLKPIEQSSKLSRVQVDIPNLFDKLWQLDVKKSSAIPPKEIRQELKKRLEEFIKRSKIAQTSASGTVFKKEELWLKQKKGNEFFVRINFESALLKKIFENTDLDNAKRLKHYLKRLQKALPIDWITAQYATDYCPEKDSEKDVLEMEIFDQIILLSSRKGYREEDIIGKIKELYGADKLTEEVKSFISLFVKAK